jgi:hypothetical protein
MKTTQTPKTLGKVAMARRTLKTLRLLARHPNGLTRPQIAKGTKIYTWWSRALGTVTRCAPPPGSMEGDGLVRSNVYEGVSGLVYTITPKGLRVLTKLEAASTVSRK